MADDPETVSATTRRGSTLNPAATISTGQCGIRHIHVSSATVARDPFDRLLAATAMHYNLPLVSADTVFDGIVRRLW